MSVMHGTSKHLRARPFRTEIASFAVGVAPAMWVSCALLGLCIIVPWAMPPVLPVVPIERMGGLNGRGQRILSVMKPFPYREPLGWPFVPHPQDGRGSKHRPRPDVVRNFPHVARRWC
jgi:hypothetical protein